MISKEEKREILSKYQRHTFDTGSPEAQIAILTERIKQLSEKHLMAGNRSDFSSTRGLKSMVSKRKRLLSYLKRKSLSKHAEILKSLDIRG